MLGESWEQHIVTELDSALNLWIDQLPDHLRWDPHRENNLFFRQSVLLYSTFYCLQITIHRPFIPSFGRSGNNGKKLTFPSLAICTNAARSCARLLDVQRRRTPNPDASPWAQGAAFTSGVVLLLSMWSGKKEGNTVNYKREIEDVQKCVEYLRLCQGRWRTASRFMWVSLSSGLFRAFTNLESVEIV